MYVNGLRITLARGQTALTPAERAAREARAAVIVDAPLTRAELRARMGLASQGALVTLSRAEVHDDASARTLLQLAAALGVTVEWLTKTGVE